MRHDVMHLLAPAKINLFLEVTGLKEDGYHTIESMIAFLDVGDHINLCPAEAFSLVVTGPFADLVPADASNLVAKAVMLMENISGRSLPVAVTVEKNIPVGAGLGGGSSDAAAMIAGLCDLFDLDIDDDARQKAALTLGADVPVCLAGRPVHASGIGEEMTVIDDCPSFDLLVVHPGVSLATPSVFKAYDMAHTDTPCCQPSSRFAPISYVDALAMRRNDLEEAAISLAPDVAVVLSWLMASGCQLARMSGSGSACFGIFADRGGAERAARQLRRDHPTWWAQVARLQGSAVVS